MFQLITPDEMLFVVMYWDGDPVLTVRGELVSLEPPQLEQASECFDYDKPLVKFILQQIIRGLEVGSLDRNNPTILDTPDLHNDSNT